MSDSPEAKLIAAEFLKYASAHFTITRYGEANSLCLAKAWAHRLNYAYGMHEAFGERASEAEIAEAVGSSYEEEPDFARLARFTDHPGVIERVEGIRMLFAAPGSGGSASSCSAAGAGTSSRSSAGALGGGGAA